MKSRFGRFAGSCGSPGSPNGCRSTPQGAVGTPGSPKRPQDPPRSTIGRILVASWALWATSWHLLACPWVALRRLWDLSSVLLGALGSQLEPRRSEREQKGNQKELLEAPGEHLGRSLGHALSIFSRKLHFHRIVAKPL